MIAFRAATKADAHALAQLIDLAGEGLPSHLWRTAAPDSDPMQTGAARAAREEGGFSYRNALVAADGDRVAAMLLDYRLDDPYPPVDPAQVSPVVLPLVELEARAPGSWYVNGLAVFEPWRRQGLGARLLAEAERRGREAGATEASIIVAERNAPARRLYERTGYRGVARAPIAPYPGSVHSGDWLLMVKPIAHA